MHALENWIVYGEVASGPSGVEVRCNAAQLLLIHFLPDQMVYISFVQILQRRNDYSVSAMSRVCLTEGLFE